MELKEFCRSIQVSDEELFSELNELEESNTLPSKQEVRLIYSDRLLPPLPQPRAQILRLDSGKPSLSDSEEPYFVEVLNRPITIHKAPKEPSTPKPMSESDRKFEKLATQPTSNMRTSDTASHGSELDIDQASAYRDNPCYFPDVETDDCAHVVSVCNETAVLEEPCVGVVENNDLILTDEQTKVHKILMND